MANDLSFNVIALDKASSTFVKAAASIDKLIAKVDALDGKDARVSVNVKTDDSTKALDSFTNRFALMSAGIIAGSPAIGAAIIGGVGAGFIGIAALALKSNADVNKAYTTLWNNVVNDTKSATAQLVPQVVGAANQIGATADRLGPQLRAGFAAAGPDINALTRGVTDFATNAMPGVTSAMQNSLPVFSGVANAAGTLGTAVGSAFQSVGQNAAAYGGFMQSLANISSSALGLVVSLVNDVATVWQQNAGVIDSSVASTAAVISGLAQGVLPVLSAALGAAASALGTIANILGPVAPLLGGVAAAALALWGAFKLSEVVTSGVKAVASAAVSMGGAMESGAAKAATLIAAEQGVAVSSSTTAAALQAAGRATGTAAVGFASTAATLAGPLGIALTAGTLLFGVFSSVMGSTSDAGDQVTNSLDGVASALQASNGAVSASVVSALQSDQSFKDAAGSAKQFGVTQSDIVSAVTSSGSSIDGLIAKLQGVVDANHELDSSESGDVRMGDSLNTTGTQAQILIGKLKDLSGNFKNQADAAKAANKALTDHANEMATSSAGQTAAAAAANSLGLSLGAVSQGFATVAAASGDASIGVQDVLDKYQGMHLATAKAASAIKDGFAQAQSSVDQARQGVSSASHSLEQASRSVADAQHQEAAAARAVVDAQQGVADAQRGVIQAQLSYTDAQRQEKDAQQALSNARQQAVRDLKALHLQLEDQYTTEASARVRLFDAQQAAAGLGVTGTNARGIAGQTVTGANEDQVKAAIDLLSAQNQLNSALNSGANLRQDVAAADKAGVNGSQSVVSAQQAVVSAQRQVADAAYGVEQANRNLQRAQQAVTDAAYNEQRAHQAVRDAEYQVTQASMQLSNAQHNLRDAQDGLSRSFDVSTAAGQRNLTQLSALTDAIKNEYGPTALGYNEMVRQVASAFGLSTDQATAYLVSLGKIPKDFKYDVTAVANVDTASLQQVFKGTSAGGYYNNSMNQKKSIGATGLAAGGPVFGMGGPRSDSIDARLSVGEYVQPADVVDHYGVGFMEALRRKQLPRFASGGPVNGVDWNAFGAGAGAAYASTVNAQTVMGFPHAPQLPVYVPPPVFSAAAGAIPGVSGGRAANKAIVQGVFASMFGWTGPQWDAATRLIMGESGFNNLAQNPTSTAFGMFQFLNSTWAGYGVPKTADPTQQAIAGGRYIRARYGSPLGAWNAWSSRSPHWYADGGSVAPSAASLNALVYGANKPRAYDNGGALPPGLSTVFNGTGRPENVRTADAEDQLVAAVRENTAAVRELRNMTMRGEVTVDGRRLLGEVRGAFEQMTVEAGL